jgi:hypothetical protein
MKNPFKFFTKVPAAAVKVVQEVGERAEARALDSVAAVLERFDSEAIADAIKVELHQAIASADFSSIAEMLKAELIQSLREEAAELRK